jgi:Flp pilus assembly protein TadD
MDDSMSQETVPGKEEAVKWIHSCFAAGRMSDAEQAARLLVQADGDDELAVHLLAQILHQRGAHGEALDVMQHVLEINPVEAVYHNDYGVMLAALGRWPEAEAAHRLSLVLDATRSDARFNLALMLFRQKQTVAALAELDLLEKTNPDSADLHALRAEILLAEGQLEMAVMAVATALERGLERVDVLVNLSTALNQAGFADDAEQLLTRAVQIAPEDSAANYHLGNLLSLKGKSAEAAVNFSKAAELPPESPEAWNNIGELHFRMQRLDEAEAAYRQALALKPDFVAAGLNLGILLLLRGDFKEGWVWYEKRWEMPVIRDNRPRFAQPEWAGESLDGKTLLIYVEQGMGDNLQFVRYLRVLRDRYPAARIYYWCLRPLFRLFSEFAASCGVEILPETVQGGLPPIDFHIALLTIPERLGTTLETIPAAVPYLVPPANLVSAWGARLAGLPGKKVGLVWASGETYLYHMFRTVQLKQLMALFDLEGISWVSLQKGEAVSQIEVEGLSGTLVNLMDDVEDFADTAAIIANLDLVLSVDTSVAHLAGAMGVPVWLLDRFDTDWRWLLNRTDSPWYPSMRIFRQRAFADWGSVIPGVVDALSAWTRENAGAVSAEPGLAEKPVMPAVTSLQLPPALKLNLGCGNRKMAGFLNVDCVAVCQPDLVVNLEQTPWPWADDAVDEIKLIHVLEHLGQSTEVFLAIIKEMYRVCREGARIEIIVPHPRSDHYLGDPTHVRPVTLPMLNLFDQRLNREWAAIGAANTPLGIILGVDFEIESAAHLLEAEWQQKLSSGQMSEAEMASAVAQYNNVVVQTTIVWRVRKGR